MGTLTQPRPFGGLAAVLFWLCLSPFFAGAHAVQTPRTIHKPTGRERISLNDGWRFSRFTSNPDSLSYDTLRPWILPSGNDFIEGTKHQAPNGTAPGSDVKFVQASFDDSKWEAVDVPHDWAIKGPFNAPGVNGGMGRLPSNGVGWYRRRISMDRDDKGKSIFLDIDGAMSYAAVWLNGHLVGGWPYGYASFRLDLTPYLKVGKDNILAIRLDNAVENSRWYPGAGLYRNVWLVKTNPTHVAQFGTFITTPNVSHDSATVDLVVDVENQGACSRGVYVETEIRVLDSASGRHGKDVVARFKKEKITVPAGAKKSVSASTTVRKPQLWGPAPEQKPNMYVAVTTLSVRGKVIDTYETPFGIRSVVYDSHKGVVFINGKPTKVYGTCNHGDHGALGAAYNHRAQQRQLEMLQEMGSNAIRTSHNPPAPELLDLADSMGILVHDEIFDVWNVRKTTNDFTTIFPDWHEPDLRAFIRRDRNHPSIIVWSFGNELQEQTRPEAGTMALALRSILLSEDPTRPTTAALNAAKPGSALADALDIISLNYQGEGQGPGAKGYFADFHAAYPDKPIWSSESASTLSSRGTYLFPVTSNKSATVTEGDGGNKAALAVSAYDLYGPPWGASPDQVFEAHDRNKYVLGEFVWTGWDYIGEPTPYGTAANDTSGARSSYFGIIDLAGFKKDRFWMYQARWKPEMKFAHILPHWSWTGEREGQVTPVHVFSSGDEAELFVNGVSQGRVRKGEYEYRFRWDEVAYQDGEVSVVVYKGGKEWARETRKTVGKAAGLKLTADRTVIEGDGADVSFVTVAVVDDKGKTVPRASDAITFSVSGPGQIVATDNGDPGDMTAFPSLTRKAFSGLALAVVKANKGASGKITVTASAGGLEGAKVVIKAN